LSCIIPHPRNAKLRALLYTNVVILAGPRCGHQRCASRRACETFWRLGGGEGEPGALLLSRLAGLNALQEVVSSRAGIRADQFVVTGRGAGEQLIGRALCSRLDECCKF